MTPLWKTRSWTDVASADAAKAGIIELVASRIAAGKRRRRNKIIMSLLNPDSSTTARGHCLCGAVQFEVRGPPRPVIYCHCSFCRRSTGHIVAATACARGDLNMLTAGSVRWYQSSAVARRGFCESCGSQLFWDSPGLDYIAIMAGSIDAPTGLTGAGHIFVGSKGDYYEICDTLPQKAEE